MKKIAAIVLLSILLFNTWGYRWLITYLEEKATLRLEQKLETGDYDESMLVEVKIPLQLPYYTNWSEYERHYGETEWNGQNYQYVKRKLFNDTLYLLCFPHTEKNNIQTAAADIFRSVNNIQRDGIPQKSHQPSVIKLMLSEFLEAETSFKARTTSDIQLSLIAKSIDLYSQFTPSTPEQPPEDMVS